MKFAFILAVLVTFFFAHSIPVHGYVSMRSEEISFEWQVCKFHAIDHLCYQTATMYNEFAWLRISEVSAKIRSDLNIKKHHGEIFDSFCFIFGFPFFPFFMQGIPQCLSTLASYLQDQQALLQSVKNDLHSTKQLLQQAIGKCAFLCRAFFVCYPWDCCTFLHDMDNSFFFWCEKKVRLHF